MNHSYSYCYEGVELGPLTLADALITVGFRNASRECFLDAAEITETEQSEWFAAYLGKPGDYMFAVRDDGKLIGQVGLYSFDVDRQACDFGRLVLDPLMSGRGLGTKTVVAACYVAFCELGMDAVCLEVLMGNERARALYEKVGFELVSQREGDDGRAILLMTIGKSEFIERWS